MYADSSMPGPTNPLGAPQNPIGKPNLGSPDPSALKGTDDDGGGGRYWGNTYWSHDQWHKMMKELTYQIMTVYQNQLDEAKAQAEEDRRKTWGT